MGPDRVMTADLPPEAAAERRRVLRLINQAIDIGLARRPALFAPEFRHVADLFLADLARLGQVVRSGGDGLDLDRLAGQGAKAAK